MSTGTKPPVGALSSALASRFRSVMGILDLNKSEIGRLAGLSRTTTSDILRGVQEGDLGQLDLICDVLGLTLWQEVKAAEDATESRRLKRLAG